MVEGGTSGSGVQWGSSTSSHSSSSSSSSKGKDTRLLIRVSPLVQSERIHYFFDRSLAMAKPPIGCGFVKKVSRRADDTVIVSIEDASIARRLVSLFSEARPKIDGHEFTIELYSSDHSKSLSSPSNHNGDKRREKESIRMSSCSTLPSPSTPSTSKRTSYSSPSTHRPSTQESTKNECAPSSSSSSCSYSKRVDPYNGIVGASVKKLPLFGENLLKDMLHEGLRETIGGYINHYNEDSGRAKVLLKRYSQVEDIPSEGSLLIQGEQATFTVLPKEETRKLYDRYLSSEKCRDSQPSTSSCPSPSSHSPSTGHRDALSYHSSRTIFVPCLRKGTTREGLRRKMERVGAVLEVEMKNGQSVTPHAIVQFAHTQGAVMAMEEHEREQKKEMEESRRSRKSAHFVSSASSLRVWVANLPPQDEDYVKKKLQDLLKGSQNPTIVVDSRRREGIIDFTTIEKAKHYLEIIKSSPLVQQSGSVQTWLVADYCSDLLYDHFIQRRSQGPSEQEKEFMNILSKMQPTSDQREQAETRMKRMKGGEEKPMEKKRSVNGENGNHSHSPSSTRRLNGEDRRSGDSGFSEDREKAQALDSDDDEMLERKWRTLAPSNDRREENGVMRRRISRLGDDLVGFIQQVPQGVKIVKKEIKEEEEGEKKENEKIPREQRVNGFRDALLNVGTPLKARGIDDIMRYRGKDPLKSPPIPISPFNGDKEKKHIVSSPPSGSRPVPLHISIPQSSSTNTLHSPYSRVPPSSSASSSRHPSISTPSTLTPRSHTLPSSVPRPPFPNEPNGDHVWSSGGTGGPSSTVGTPTSSRLPLSRRESVCSNSSQSTPLPSITPSTSGTSGTVYTPNALKSPPVNSWSSTPNAWKGGPSLSSPNLSSINRSRPSMDHKSSTPSSHSRPSLALPKSSMDKAGFGLGPSSSLPKTPSLPRSSSMNEKKPIISRESSKDIVNNIIQNKSGHLKNMQRIPKKDNRERDEKEERREKKREEKDRERREDREERKEKKEDRKKSRENETKEEKARRRELKRKERDKEDRKKSSTDKEKKRKSIDVEKKKKKKHSKTRSDSEDSEMDSDPSCSRQIDSDAALARQMAYGGSSMYDRVKGRRSGGGKEDKKIAALETLRMKNKKKTSKKRVHLSSSESDGEMKESGKKTKREEEESSDDDEEERERRKKEKKREKERTHSTEESDTDEERHKKRKKEKKILKKNSTVDLFSDADSVKSERKETLSKKRSHDKEVKGESPSPSSSHPPPEKKVKKEESSSSQSESEDEAEISSKKSEVSTSSWRAGEDKNRRLSESSVATHSEKDESWKSPSSGSVEKEIKEEPKEDRPPRLLTKAAMKEFNVGASSSPAGASWMNSKDDTGLNLSSDSSQSSSDSEEEKEEIEERKDENEEEKRKESEDTREEEEKMEEDNVEIKEEETIEETKEYERMEEEKEEEVKMEVEEIQPMEKDEEAESAVRGLESPTDDAIEETEKAVESIFDEEEEPEARYPSNDFLNAHDMIMSSSSSQCSSPKILPSSSLPHRPTPLHPSTISSPSILSPSPLHHQLLQSHCIPPPVSSPLISSPLISPSTSRPASIHLNVRPISQESSSQHVHDDNGVATHQEKSWTSQGSSSDGPSPSPSHHTMMNKEEILKKFPVQWSGPMKMKASEMQTSWFKLHGDEELLNSVLSNSLTKIEVRGKMRLDNEKVGQLTSSMATGEGHACLIVTPAGHNQDEVVKTRELFVKNLVGYFQSKDIAGITELLTMDGQTYIGHCFAPGPFVKDYLVPLYPDFHDLLQRRHADAFLLVILKRRDDE